MNSGYHFVNEIIDARSMERNVKTFDALVRRYLDAACYANSQGKNIESALATDRNAVSGCGLFDMDAYDKVMDLCRMADIGLGIFAEVAKDSYSSELGLGWNLDNVPAK